MQLETYSRAMAVAVMALVAIGLAGCAGLPKPELSAALRTQYHISDIVVETPANAEIWWGDAERELAAKEGVSFSDNGDGSAISQDEYAKRPETRAYVGKRIAGIVKDAVQTNTQGVLNGSQPAKLRVEVRGLHISSAIQRIVVGGGHNLFVDAWLVDAKTDKQLTPRQKFTGLVFAGQGVGGVLADQVVNAATKDPVYRLADEVGQKMIVWLRPPGT
ncbi:MAG: hypothetical protein RIC14_12965 [Filomicrobium sp.]